MDLASPVEKKDGNFKNSPFKERQIHLLAKGSFRKFTLANGNSLKQLNAISGDEEQDENLYSKSTLCL